MKRTPGVAGGFILPAAGPGRQLLSDDERSVAWSAAMGAS
jgi:hypothetical protein